MRLKLKLTLLVAAQSLIAAAIINQADDAPNQNDNKRVTANVGHVVFPLLADEKSTVRVSRKLHFCVFDNGQNDQIYVGTRSGSWSEGEFDLSVGDRVVATLKVPNLLYDGVLLPLGDVFDGPPDPDGFDADEVIAVTRVKGLFK